MPQPLATDQTQGMPDPLAIMVTFSTPSPGTTDADFNAWYDGEHVPAILQHVPGVARVSRFRLAGDEPPADPAKTPPFVAVYEFDRPAAEVLPGFAEAGAQGKVGVSDVLDQAAHPPVTLVYDFLSTAARPR